MNPVVHFEMPAKDKKRTADFYSKVFGWKLNQLGQEMGQYLLATTAETDNNGMVKTPGAINGGFFDFKDEEGFNVPHIVISVNNIDEGIKAVNGSGGRVTSTKMDIPGIGTYVSFKDTEGNCVGMLEPKSGM
ncbi:MAG: VOC family protein [Candidatus Levybacteria bacterium]|nr:VOC family protein [Candidatus Levybacteria bacterium]